VQVACHRSGVQLQHSTTELDLLCSKRVRFRVRVFIRETVQAFVRTSVSTCEVYDIS